MKQVTSTILLLVFIVASYHPAHSQNQRPESTLWEIVTLIRDMLDDSLRHSRHTTGYILTHDQLLSLPYRERDEFLRLLPGVHELNGNLHVQGGRPHDIGHYINGVRLTNRYLGTSELHIIPEAIESLSLTTGGYSAALGFATAGIVSTRLRTGGDQLRVRASILTDNIVKTGNEFLNTTSFGYRTSVLTAEGTAPLGEGVRFFLAAENHYVRNRQARFVEPFRFDTLKTDMFDTQPGTMLPGPVAFSKNFIPNNWLERNTVQGTLLYEFSPFSLNLAGSYQHNSSTTGAEWPSALVNIFNQRRVPKTNVISGFLSLAGRYNLNDEITINASATFYTRSSELDDPDFGTDWKLYTDSIANAQKGYGGFSSRWSPPPPYYVIQRFMINREGTPSRSFSRDDQRAWILNGSASFRLSDDWSITIGGAYERWTMRRFTISRIDPFMQYVTASGFNSSEERRVLAGTRGRVNHYGYDVDGNRADDGFDAPYKPLFTSVFVENAITQDHLEISGGLRYEYFNPRFKVPKDMNNIPFINGWDVLDEARLVDAKGVGYVLPKAAMKYTVSKRTVVFAHFQKTSQMPPLLDLYAGNTYISRTISPTTRGNAFLPAVGFTARPERATTYEIGLQQRIGKSVRFDFSLYTKEIFDLLFVTRTSGYSGPVVFLNGDQATAKGINLFLDVHHPSGLAGHFYYSLADARGISSSPRARTLRAETGEPIELISAPLDFQQTHTATAVLFYRSGERDDALSDIAAAIVLSYGSGHRYTRIKQSASGSATLWEYGVVALRDPRFAEPAEPLNSSTTPPTVTLDLRISKAFPIGPVTIELYALALNLLNKKNILNLYPTTGSAEDDGWLGSPYNWYAQQGQFADFYRAINLQNRWAYSSVTGNDIYGSPRQIRFGMKVGL